MGRPLDSHTGDGKLGGLNSKSKILIIKATSKNVIPAKAGIQKPVTLLDSRLRGSDKFIIIRGSL